MPIITLTTDFGMRDGYVGAVKGVLCRLAPEATLVDIAHDIPRGDVAHAAWVVATSTCEFPHETIHLVIVDPGVGGTRQAVIGRLPAAPPRGEQYYVGPDNGVFGHVPIDRAWQIDEAAVPGPISATFHGRDLFAPAAALLARGEASVLGKPAKLAGVAPWGARMAGVGRVVHVDQYGNLITDLPVAETQGSVQLLTPAYLSMLQRSGVDEGLLATVPGAIETFPIRATYEDVAPGELVVYVGSAGTIEIAVRDGRADARLEVARGTELVRGIKPPPAPSRGPYR